MLDHISISVNNFKESIAFYDASLLCLGIERLMDFETEEGMMAGYGVKGKPFFWISKEAKPNMQEFVGKTRGFHIAFNAVSKEAIHAWYEKCLQLGAKDNGRPGPRPDYHPDYYAAYVIDPNGYRIEAVLLHDMKI